MLSPKDLCSLEMLPELINTNINSLKIEGRMKTPEYVATVTRIYRKYIDKIYNDEPYIIEEQDKIDLLQVFNRGGFSSGHLSNEPNKDLIFKDKPNNMGIYIGNVSNYNSNKGHIFLTLTESVGIGDTITFENENSRYTISELMNGNENITESKSHSKVIIGRMKGNIKIGNKIYKISSKSLSSNVKYALSKENIKQPINAVLDMHIGEPIKLKIYDSYDITITVISNEEPEIALNSPITKERLEKQLNKLNDTPFYLKNIKINLDNNLFLPHISTINELRRNAIEKYSQERLKIHKRKSNYQSGSIIYNKTEDTIYNLEHKICLLLNTLNFNFDYSKLKNVDKLYIPLKYFTKEYDNILKKLSYKFAMYIYLPNIIKPNFRNLFKNTIDSALKEYDINGFVLSNIGNFDLLKDYKKDYEFISNYTLNIFNNLTSDTLDADIITISPELSKDEINSISLNCDKPCEFIVYGNIPLMTSNYCLLGKSNKCYPECKQKCLSDNKYYIKDRMNFLFRVIPDNIQTITTIFNSKINSISTKEINNVTNYRIDILDENIDEINHIIETVKNGNRIEGNNYTNGNLNRIV